MENIFDIITQISPNVNKLAVRKLTASLSLVL